MNILKDGFLACDSSFFMYSWHSVFRGTLNIVGCASFAKIGNRIIALLIASLQIKEVFYGLSK
nr:MAG TPA: hypothetical protein [Caudoviricetes sp.]